MKSSLTPRIIGAALEDRLDLFPAVALLGPRQVGKTTLARSIVEDSKKGNSIQNAAGNQGLPTARPGHYLDLEDPVDLAKLSDARSYLDALRNRLVVLDEIHRAPELFGILRGIIDDRIWNGEPAGHFLLVGSASIELMRQSGQTLAGRLGYLNLDPFDLREVGPDALTRLWVRGGFPRSFSAEDEARSVLWRQDYIRTYLERDIPMLGPRIPAETMRRFWTMIAHAQGGLWNASALVRSLGVAAKTVTRYLDLLVNLLLVRQLPPLQANVGKRLTKAPKVYIRDSGIVHALLGIHDRDALYGHPVAGGSWEGFVIETLIRAAPSWTRASFYRTATGVEIDLVLELPGARTWAFKVKRGLAARLTRNTRVALEDVQPDRASVVYGVSERYSLADGVEAISIFEMASELASL